MDDFTFAAPGDFLRHLAGVNLIGARLDLRQTAIRDHTLRYLGVVYGLGAYDEVSPPEWVRYSDGSWWLMRGEKHVMFAPSGKDVIEVPALGTVREGDDLPALFHTLMHTLEAFS